MEGVLNFLSQSHHIHNTSLAAIYYLKTVSYKSAFLGLSIL